MYPGSPTRKWPNPDPEGPGGVESAPGTVQPEVVQTPQVVAGAPKLNNFAAKYTGRIPRAMGKGGPENWDKPERDVFSGEALKTVPSIKPVKTFDAQEVLATDPKAVEHLDMLLEKEMKKRSQSDIANDMFWTRFKSLRKGYAAEILADIVALLSASSREFSAPELTPEQQEWIQEHPLTKWLNWWKPGGSDILGL